MMSKTAWILAAVVALAGTGVAYVALQYRFSGGSSACEPVPSAAVPPSEARVNELSRRRLEGVGDIRDLKPVPLPPGGAK